MAQLAKLRTAFAKLTRLAKPALAGLAKLARLAELAKLATLATLATLAKPAKLARYAILANVRKSFQSFANRYAEVCTALQNRQGQRAVQCDQCVFTMHTRATAEALHFLIKLSLGLTGRKETLN
ncbi:MAG: hypothetical protein ABJN02_00015 [Lentilitoribacter sp.]